MLKYLLIGWTLVLLQGLTSYWDGYLTEAQMRRVHGITNGWSFMEHGGMWVDAFIITPIFAYILTHYQTSLFSKWGLTTLLAIVVIIGIAAYLYSHKPGFEKPEAHRHDGKTTAAGYIHGTYSLIAAWAIAMFYTTSIKPATFHWDLVWISCLLTPFFFVGTVKFNSSWRPDTMAWWLSLGGPAVIWTIAWVRCKVV